MNNTSNFNNTIDFETVSGYAYAAAVPLTLIGLFTNIFLLYILIKHKIFAKTTYYLLRISVVSDIICNFATATGYVIAAGATISYPDGQILCHTLTFIFITSYGISVMTLCIIGIDRYFVIVRPLSPFYLQYKHQFIGGLLALASIMVIGSALPSLYLVGVYPDDTKFYDFTTLTPALSCYLILSTITLYIIPILTLTVTYSKIISYMRNYVRPGEIITNLDTENDKKNKLIKTLMSIAAAYLLISWPYFATISGIAIKRRSLRQVRRLGLVYYLLAIFSFSITMTISTLNPFLYLKFDLAIRLKAKKHLFAIYDTAKSRILTTDDVVSFSPTSKSDAV